MNNTKELTKEKLEEFLLHGKIELKTAQESLCFAIIKRLYRRCKADYYFRNIKVCNEKGIVIDGNHRYIAYLISEIEFDTVRGTSSHCDIPKPFNKIKIDYENDWDVHRDAKYLIDGVWLEEFKRD